MHGERNDVSPATTAMARVGALTFSGNGYPDDVVAGSAAVGRDLNALDAAVWSPRDAADRDSAGGELFAVLDGIDTGLGFYRAFLGPGALDPVRIEVPVGELYLGDPLGGRDVAVEARDD